jgi:ribonucleoside-diphosphate reductase alpha chain
VQTYGNLFLLLLNVEEFLDTKKVNADEDLRLSTISTGLIVPSKFFDLAKEINVI